MLTINTKHRCDCCGDEHPKRVYRQRVYRWHAYWYCITCLHSIGMNTWGYECTDRQYREAWRKIMNAKLDNDPGAKPDWTRRSELFQEIMDRLQELPTDTLRTMARDLKPRGVKAPHNPNGL